MNYTQTYRARARYRTFYQYGPHRLVVAVECRVEGLLNSLVALFDTGAEWSVLPTAIAQAIGLASEYDEPVEELSARGHKLTGRRVVIPLSFPQRKATRSSYPMRRGSFQTRGWVRPSSVGPDAWKRSVLPLTRPKTTSTSTLMRTRTMSPTSDLRPRTR